MRKQNKQTSHAVVALADASKRGSFAAGSGLRDNVVGGGLEQVGKLAQETN